MAHAHLSPQFELFGSTRQAPPVETPAARVRDPASSHDAAAVITRTGVRYGQQQRALAAVRAFPGLTSLELAMSAGMDRYELAKRLPEVRTAGLVVNPTDESKPVDPVTGTRPPFLRRCSVSGRSAMIWNPREG